MEEITGPEFTERLKKGIGYNQCPNGQHNFVVVRTKAVGIATVYEILVVACDRCGWPSGRKDQTRLDAETAALRKHLNSNGTHSIDPSDPKMVARFFSVQRPLPLSGEQ